MIPVGWSLLGIAALFALAGAYPAALLVAIVVGLLALFAPDDAREDARRRNRARRWQ